MKKGHPVPPEISAVGFDFDWDNKKLWALDLLVEDMAVSELTWHFELPFWREGETWFVVRPKDVLADPDKYPEHRDRIAKSNPDLPLHIMWHKGRWVFLDGMHRLAKAVQAGRTTVKVQKVPPEKIPEILEE